MKPFAYKKPPVVKVARPKVTPPPPVRTTGLRAIWTQDLPTKAGHYWHVCPPGVEVECVELVLDDGRVGYAAVGLGRHPTPIYPGGWWMRIEKPAPPEVRP